MTLFSSHNYVREVLAIWKNDYNTVRPHSDVGNLRPAAYARLSVPLTQRDGALRYTGASALRPILFAEPTRLKSTRDPAHRWMKEGAQVTRYGR